MPVSTRNFSLAVRTRITFSLFCVMSTFCYSCFAEGLQLGSRYKIIRPVYLMAEYNDVNDKRISKEAARAFLHSERFATRHFTAFQCEVPAGTIMTIISSASKIWYLPFLSNRYLVRLDPDLSRGLDVELDLDRGLEGSLDGLNPKVFSREKPTQATQGSEPGPHVDAPELL